MSGAEGSTGTRAPPGPRHRDGRVLGALLSPSAATPGEVRHPAAVRSAPGSLSLPPLAPALRDERAGAWLLVVPSRAGEAGGFRPGLSSARMKVPRKSGAARRSWRLLLHGRCSSRLCQSRQCDRARRQPDGPMRGARRQDGSGAGCRRGEGSAARWHPRAPGQCTEQNEEGCHTRVQSVSEIKHESFAQGPFSRWR